MSRPHILIVGGGIGGLALAQGLKKHRISYTVFERDPSPVARAQGYRLRISGNGAVALHECLDKEIWDLFERICADMKLGGGNRLNALDSTDTSSLFGGPPGAGRPGPRGPGAPPGIEGPPGGPGSLMQRVWGAAGLKADPNVKQSYTVDRKMLRSLLALDQEEHIKFGKTFIRYETTSDGVKAFFGDGTSEEGTLLVGAEGVASAVRKQLLPNHRFVDTGTRCLYGKTPITDDFVARFTPNAMNGMCIVQDVNKLGVFLEAIRFPTDASVESGGKLVKTEDYMYWVFGGSTENVGLSDDEFHALSGQGAANLTLNLTKHWDPAIKSLFELQDLNQCAPLRLVSAKPARPDWKPSAPVTLLGDAAHAMMPAGGSGANTALADAALLLKLLVEEGVSEEVIAKYVDGMWEYALPAIQASADGARKLLGFQGFEGAKEVIF